MSLFGGINVRGHITLIGAGPGEPELLTVKALRKLREADAVYYDRLINTDLLNYCSERCEKIDVGKKPKHHKIPQSEIEQLIIDKAKEGKRVVRLKSGDPYVFGRGGEEGRRIVSEDISFEVIPGITSAIGGLAYAGIPITHRDCASSFHVITGHLKTEETQLDWAHLAHTEGTLVFLMGMSELETITTELIAHGKAADTPVAIIRWATRQDQTTVIGDLSSIYQVAQEAKMTSPSLIVMGDVVSHREYLNFYETKPLFGKRVTVPYTEKKKMYHRFIDAGASVVELEKLSHTYLDNELQISDAKELVFLDADSVTLFVSALIKQQQDIRTLLDKKIVTIGHHTELAIKQLGLLPEASYKSMADYQFSNSQCQAPLYIGEKSYIQTLSAKVSLSHSWIPYELIGNGIAKEQLEQTDYLFFPSSKNAHYFLQNLSDDLIPLVKETKIAVMGEMTARVFEEKNITVMSADCPTFESVLEKIGEENEK